MNIQESQCQVLLMRLKILGAVNVSMIKKKNYSKQDQLTWPTTVQETVSQTEIPKGLFKVCTGE